MRKILKGVYAVEFLDGIKIGMSTNILARLLTYKSPWSKPIVSVHFIECSNASKVERVVLDNYSEYIIEGSREYLIGVSIAEIVDYLATLAKSLPRGFYGDKCKTYKKPFVQSLEHNLEVKKYKPSKSLKHQITRSKPLITEYKNIEPKPGKLNFEK